MSGSIFLKSPGDNGKLVSRDGVRDDKYSMVRSELVKELNRKADKVIPISCYNRPSIRGRIF